MSASNTYTVRDATARQVCSLAGISVARERLNTFRELKAGIDVSLRQLESERTWAQRANKALLVLKFTKATCDAFIGMAAELSSYVPGAGKGANAVRSGYGIASTVADTAATAAAGGEVNYVTAGTGIVKSAAGFVDNSGASFLLTSNAIKAEMIVAAMNSDRDGVNKSAAEYGTELAKFSLSALDSEEAKDALSGLTNRLGLQKTTGPTKAATFVGIATEAFNYHQALNGAFDQYFDEQLDAAGRYQSGKAQFMRLGRQLQGKIDALEQFISSCELQLAQEKASPAQPRSGVGIPSRN